MNVTVDTTVGKAAQTIVRYAEENDVDHVVLGSRGCHELSRFLPGNVAEQVALLSSGSVTIIRDEEPGREP